MTGAGEAARALANLAGDLGDLSEPARDAAEQIAAEARRRAPVATGRLRSRIRVTDTTPTGSSVTVAVSYARPALARRNFLAPAEELVSPRIPDLFEQHVAGDIRRRGLNR